MQIRVIKYSWVILGRPFTRLQEPTAGISHGPKTGTLLGMGAGFYHSINRKSAGVKPIEDGTLSQDLSVTRLQCIRQAGKFPLCGERKGERHGND